MATGVGAILLELASWAMARDLPDGFDKPFAFHPSTRLDA